MNDDTKAKSQTKGQGGKQSKAPTKVDARQKLAEMKAKEELAQLEQQLSDVEGHDWFVRCRRCHGVAFFLTRHPQDVPIGPNEWYSDYKGVEDKFVTNEVNCQECARVVQVDFPGSIRDGFLPKPRYVQSIKDIERRQEEAENERTKQKAMNVARMSMLSVDAGEVS